VTASDVKWGICSTGWIAHEFARALTRVPSARLVAIGSRSRDRADAFAAEHGVARAHASLEALLADDDVDVVYVASPQSEHRRDAVLAAEAGKHVLVEKPFALSAAEAQEVFDAAAANGVFAMEAMWSRFVPAHVRLRELVAAGVIGDVLSIDASFGFPLQHDPDHRLHRLELGGGALLDLGVYPVNTALQLLGPPVDVVATAAFGPTGVDVHTAVAMRFDAGAIATARCSLSASDLCTARVIGSKGLIEIPHMHFAPEYLDVRRFFSGLGDERIHLPIGDDGLRYQVHEVHACLEQGLQQSKVMSWQHTIDLMTVLDRARACIGLTFPNRPARPASRRAS
jgi:predicted dehydrogenase